MAWAVEVATRTEVEPSGEAASHWSVAAARASTDPFCTDSTRLLHCTALAGTPSSAAHTFIARRASYSIGCSFPRSDVFVPVCCSSQLRPRCSLLPPLLSPLSSLLLRCYEWVVQHFEERWQALSVEAPLRHCESVEA